MREIPVYQKGSRESIEDSPSYPGLKMKATNHYFETEFSENEYRSEGYIEHQEDKDTYFVWKG